MYAPGASFGTKGRITSRHSGSTQEKEDPRRQHFSNLGAKRGRREENEGQRSASQNQDSQAGSGSLCKESRRGQARLLWQTLMKENMKKSGGKREGE